VSCTCSPTIDETDSMSWFMGDAAGAFVVGPVESGRGIRGMHTIHTADTCGAASFLPLPPVGDRAAFRFQPGRDAGRILRDSSGGTLLRCCEGAAAAAGVGFKDIDFFVFNTPTAWFAPFCSRALGVDPSRTVNPFPRYGNIGPALSPVNFWHAVSEGRIRPDDLVMFYAVGSVSSASAAVMRCGEVAAAPAPPPPIHIDPAPGALSESSFPI
jgi:3-oxoacyl-[acyl-carrier-protein] synthase-3